VGDLLVGVATRRGLIVDLCRVDSVQQDGRGFWAEWNVATDVRLLPGIPLKVVTSNLRSDLPTNWTRLDGDDARTFVEELIAAVAAPNVAYDEGVEHVRLCRDRSRGLREDALAKYDYTCYACGLRPRAAFGDLGVRTLDCHHLEPMAARPGKRKSTVDDVRVVCAVCHRLVHTFPSPDLEGLEMVCGWWEYSRAAGVIGAPMPV